MRNILIDAQRVLRVVPKTISLVWEVSRTWTLGWIAILLVRAFLPAASILLIKRIVDDLVALMNTPENLRDFSNIVFSATGLGIVFVLTESLQTLHEWCRTWQTELVQDRVQGLIHQKSVEVDYAYFETPKWFDQLSQASSQGSARFMSLVEGSGSSIQSGITLLTLGGVLIFYSAWLPLILAVAAIPSLWVILRYNRDHHAWWDKTTPDRRRAEYLHYVMTSRGYAAEVRLSELNEEFLAAHQKVRRSQMDGRLQLMGQKTRGQVTTSVFSVLVVLGCLGWMGLQVLAGLATLGGVAAFHQTLVRGQTQLKTFFRSLAQLHESGLFLESLHAFLEVEPKVVSPSLPVNYAGEPNSKIEFRNVSFAYPGTETNVFDDFNLEIEAGKLIALVGRNGAGKTTMVKLLSRLYDPQSGTIEFDGTDIKSFGLADLRRSMTVLHQAPMIYYETARKNITMGDLNQEYSDDEVIAAAKAAEAWEFIAELPNGLDTLLGKGFVGGTDLSIGQYQRLALARASIRNSKIVILDEPTSFMDPWAEVKWLSGVRKLLQGRTAIIITHRFSTARMADEIHVLDNGRIVEAGAHEDLMALDGQYASSWREQEDQKLRSRE